MRKLKTYQPTRFMADGSHYNEELAELAVAFIGCLKHTKGEWYGQNFDLIDWQEQIIRDLFGIVKPNGYRLCGDCQETGKIGAGRCGGVAPYLWGHGIRRRGLRVCF